MAPFSESRNFRGWWVSKTPLEQKLVILSSVLFILSFCLTISVIVLNNRKFPACGGLTTPGTTLETTTETDTVPDTTTPAATPPTTVSSTSSSTVSTTSMIAPTTTPTAAKPTVKEAPTL